MKTQELLSPRFEVIEDYPNSIYKVGSIINTGYDRIFCDPNSIKFSDFPHLFRKIQWFENRKEEEMPMFLKHKSLSGKTTYHKVILWDLSNPQFIQWKYSNQDFGNLGMWSINYNYMPCSEEEYLQNNSGV
jgi:hypothetical protein